MTMLGTLEKTDADTLDYTVRFDRWIRDADRIVVAEVVITQSCAKCERVEYTDKSVKLWIDGGKAGETAHITLEITTIFKRIKQVCFRLRIKECLR